MIKTKLIEKINNITTQEELINLSKQLNLPLEINEIGVPIWVTFKEFIPARMHFADRQEFLNPNIQKLVNNVDKVKVVLVDGYYINPELQLKLKPEWVDVIEE